jgi:L,D-peptidoglycan transpeptidase YkuD (ErfK/YbiS/YcfS/YnhG family)
MIKTFLILLIFPILLLSSQQILLVTSEDFNTSKANLKFFEDSKLLYTTTVNLGKNGLGWGIGVKKLTQKVGEPLKYEGDKKAPAGIFKLTTLFGYGYSKNYKLPFLHTSDKLICVDDSDSNFYNQIIEQEEDVNSFEYMKRKDHQYKFGVTVEHNKMGVSQRGSCIFLHIQREKGAGTAGCTSMSESALQKIISLLDKEKNPLLIQVTKRSLPEIKELYPELFLK